MADDPMWCVVMFDLPVKTKRQRGEASRFRNVLVDDGYWRAQYSVYVRYAPTVAGEQRRVSTIRQALPTGGEVRVLYVTDREWSSTIRFRNDKPVQAEPEPQQLMIF